MKSADQRKKIEVWADWATLTQPMFMGFLYAMPIRGKEVFSFEYDTGWLKSPHAQIIDPALGLYQGPQYAPEGHNNFGIFLDSSPDRWGRMLMDRREALIARQEGRKPNTLYESDYLLGVHDKHRLGGLRFRLKPDGPFLADHPTLASPPWTSLHELEDASLQLEKDEIEKDVNYSKWLNMLIVPGSSLGGARPKASVVDHQGQLWIAKFPSQNDKNDVGAWEDIVGKLAQKAGLATAQGYSRKFGHRYHTFLTRRFDRDQSCRRLHFASAMTLLKRTDGDHFSTGVSYLELVQFILQNGSQPNQDLEQLWRRIVFFICISNVDDHLRNHGFMLEPTGWRLSPAYDMNPVETGNGLTLNISETDNAQDLDLAREVSKHFYLKLDHAEKIIQEVVHAVKQWRQEAGAAKISLPEQDRMESAFRVADTY